MSILQDLVIERYADGEFWVLSPLLACRGDVLSLELAGSAVAMTLTVQVVDVEPAAVNGIVKHRLRLRLVDKDVEAGQDSQSLLPGMPVEGSA